LRWDSLPMPSKATDFIDGLAAEGTFRPPNSQRYGFASPRTSGSCSSPTAAGASGLRRRGRASRIAAARDGRPGGA
jgi:hypothetical protein